MTINSVNPNDPLLNVQGNNSTPVTKTDEENEVTQNTTVDTEEELQTIEFGDETISLDLNSQNEITNASKEHQLQMQQLQQRLEEIRQEKQSLLSQLAFVTEADERTSITSQITELNDEINTTYMDIIKEMQNYNVELQKVIAGTMIPSVEQTSTVQEIKSSGTSPELLQSSLDGYDAELGQKLGESALIVDNTHGWCLAGVNDSLGRIFGTGLYYESAYMAADDLSNGVGVGAHFKEVSVSRDDLASLPAGCIIVWGPTASNQHGHISICLGDGRESSDHISDQMTTYSDEYHVYIPIG